MRFPLWICVFAGILAAGPISASYGAETGFGLNLPGGGEIINAAPPSSPPTMEDVLIEEKAEKPLPEGAVAPIKEIVPSEKPTAKTVAEEPDETKAAPEEEAESLTVEEKAASEESLGEGYEYIKAMTEVEASLLREYGPTGLKVFEALDGKKNIVDVLTREGFDDIQTEDMIKWFEARTREMAETARAEELSGRPAEGALYVQASVALMEKVLGLTHPAIGANLSYLARLHEASGRFELLEGINLRIIGINEKRYGRKHPALSASLAGLAEYYEKTGDFVKAEAALVRGLDIVTGTYGEKHITTADMTVRLASLYKTIGMHAESRALYAKVLEAYEEIYTEDNARMADVHSMLGALDEARGDEEASLVHFEEALDIIERSKAEGQSYVSSALRNLASAHSRMGNFGEAEALLIRALQLDEASGGAEGDSALRDLDALASMYQRSGRTQEAEILLQRTLGARLKKPVPNHAEIDRNLRGLAFLYEKTGRNREAEEYFKNLLSRAESRRGRSHPAFASALNDLAGLYFRQGEYADAEAFLRAAVMIAEGTLGPEHLDTARWRANLGIVYIHSGKNFEGFLSLRQALSVVQRHYPAMASGLRPEEAAMLRSDILEALDALVSLGVAGLKDNTLVASQILGAYSRWSAYLSGAPLALEEALSAKDAKTALIYKNLLRLRRETASAMKAWRGPVDFREYSARLEELRIKVRAHEEALRELIPALASGYAADNSGQKEFSASMPADSVFIYYAKARLYPFDESEEAESHYFAFLFTSGSNETRLIDLGGAEAVEKDIKALAEELRFPIKYARPPLKELIEKLSARIHDVAIAPLADSIKAAKRIYIRPGGLLSAVPFALLSAKDAPDDSAEIIYMAEASDILRRPKAQPRKPASAIVIGSPKYDHRIWKGEATKPLSSGLFKAFPFEPSEILANEAFLVSGAIKETYGFEPLSLTGAGADEDALALKQRTEFLHLSLRGYFPLVKSGSAPGIPLISRRELSLGPETSEAGEDLWYENPLLTSGLALAGAEVSVKEGWDTGILTPFEAIGLPLTGMRTLSLNGPDPEDPESYLLLKRAFIIAGAESAICTLWPVKAETEGEFLALYYAFQRAGRLNSDAFAMAQKSMKQKAKDSLDWAAFTITGGN